MLGDNDNLEKFFEAAPGFFSSKLVKRVETDSPVEILARFWGVMDGLMNRTLSSNSVIESVKTRRAIIDASSIICRDIVSTIPCSFSSQYETLSGPFDQPPVSIERVQTMARPPVCLYAVLLSHSPHMDMMTLFPSFFFALTSQLMPFWMPLPFCNDRISTGSAPTTRLQLVRPEFMGRSRWIDEKTFTVIVTFSTGTSVSFSTRVPSRTCLRKARYANGLGSALLNTS